MPKFDVRIERITVYEIIADDPDAAIDAVLDGQGIEVGGETTDAHAELSTD